MIELTITRAKSTPFGTPGVLKSSAGFSCDSLELPWNNNKTGISCILPGTYRAIMWWSPTLNRIVVRLEDKNGRKDCLIHNGNWAGIGDGRITQIHGCTEVGQGYGDIMRHDGIMQFGIKNSGQTLSALIDHLKSAFLMTKILPSFNVTYQWGEGCTPLDTTDAQLSC